MPEIDNIPKHHIARLVISDDLLKDILHLPDDTRFLSSDVNVDRFGSIVFLIETDDLPAIKDNEYIPTVNPQYIRTVGDNGETIRIERVDWGWRA